MDSNQVAMMSEDELVTSSMYVLRSFVHVSVSLLACD